MTSFLVRHGEADPLIAKGNPAEQASLPACKEGRLLLMRHLITQTKPNRLGLAQRAGVVKRGWLSVLSTLAIGFVCLASPLRAQFAYVANGSDNTVSAYSIGSNGALTPVPGSPFAAGNVTDSVAVDPTGKFAYVTNQGFPPTNIPGTISAYSIASNGALTPVPGSPFAAVQPGSVAVDPTGRFAYVTNSSVEHGRPDTVSGYSIDRKTGALTPVPGSPFATGFDPFSVAVDPTGRFAYVANLNTNGVPGGNTVSGYSIDGKTGALTPVPGSPFATGTFPVSVAVDPTGRFAYEANRDDNTVSAYSIASNGALKPVPGSPFKVGNFPISLAVDPMGKFAYVANGSDNTVSGYSIDRKTGALTPVPGSPFKAGSGPGSVAVDPTGRFAYVANSGFSISPGTISAYSIASNGALTPVPGSPFATGHLPVSVGITPLVHFATSFAKLEIEGQHRPGFDLKESFTLGRHSNGINPVTEKVTLQIGTFSVTIPAGSFEQDPNRRFEFEGVINDVSLEVQIVPLGNNIFTLKAEGTGVHLTGLTNPVTVVLTIGVNTGTTTVKAHEHDEEDD